MWLEQSKDIAAALTDPARLVPYGINNERDRFDVYRNNVAGSLKRALGETFPVVKRLVGDDFFSAMAGVYVRDNIPASPLLFEYGATFADFIDGFEPAGELPYLSDVARLERLWLDAYHAADAVPLKIDALAAIAEDELDDLTLTLHPAAFLFRSAYPVLSIWQAHQRADAPDLSALSWQPERMLIVRPALDVALVRLDAAAYAFVAGLAAGQSLGNVCGSLVDIADVDPPVHLAQLFQAGAVQALDRSCI
jgi:hypothetical protein